MHHLLNIVSAEITVIQQGLSIKHSVRPLKCCWFIKLYILLWELRYICCIDILKNEFIVQFTKKTLQENVLRALNVCLEFVFVFQSRFAFLVPLPGGGTVK